MKITKKQLKQIIKEEIQALSEQELDKFDQNKVEEIQDMIFGFMANGKDMIDPRVGPWTHESIIPATATLEKDGEKIVDIINDAFNTVEKNKRREQKAGAIDQPAILVRNLDDDGKLYITFSILPGQGRGGVATPGMQFLVLDNPKGKGIIVQKKPERMNYNEPAKRYQVIKESKMKITKKQLKQIIKEELKEVGVTGGSRAKADPHTKALSDLEEYIKDKHSEDVKLLNLFNAADQAIIDLENDIYEPDFEPGKKVKNKKLLGDSFPSEELQALKNYVETIKDTNLTKRLVNAEKLINKFFNEDIYDPSTEVGQRVKQAHETESLY